MVDADLAKPGGGDDLASPGGGGKVASAGLGGAAAAGSLRGVLVAAGAAGVDGRTPTSVEVAGTALLGTGEEGCDGLGESVPRVAGDSGRPLARASLVLETDGCFCVLGVAGFCELALRARADAELAESGGMSESRNGLPTMMEAGEGAADMGLPDAHDAVLGKADDSASEEGKKSVRLADWMMPNEAGLILCSVSLAA